MERNKGNESHSPRFQDEPIAVIGIGCRFPCGIRGPEQFWSLLSDGKSVVTEIPGSRHLSLKEKSHKLPVQKGGFFNHIDYFDAEFFNLTAEEARLIDPQHRLLLEMTWEAVENGGYPISTLQEEKTGVFVSSTSHEYQDILLKRDEASNAEIFRGSGNIAAERISSTFGFHGPSIVLDTACSSSLVAVHYAANSLRLRECKYALAGGVNLLLSSEPELLSQSDHLSPNGTCYAFDRRANGFSLGEGCGIVLLKPLSDALEDGDAIYSVIRTSVVTNVGATKFTSVSPRDIEDLFTETLARGGIDPKDIGYIEANGTGNPDEDIAELIALDRVYGEGRPLDNPLAVGSVKTNVGHLGAAAGIASFIKASLALNKSTHPPHLNSFDPTPRFDWGKSPLSISPVKTPWEKGKRARIAAVSSFGICGTNIHLLLEEAPLPTEQKSPTRREQLLLLSARNEAALRELAENYCKLLSELPEEHTAAICYTSQVGREHLEERLAVTGADSEGLFSGLKSYLHGVSSKDDIFGRVDKNKAMSLSFLFPGTALNCRGMGKELYENEPAFREALEECDAVLKPLLGCSFLECIYGEDKTGFMDRSEIVLSATFALQYSLARLWTSWGIKPASLLGQGIGELVAATVGGVFSLKKGLSLCVKLASHLHSSIPLKPSKPSAAFENTIAQVFSKIKTGEPVIPIISSMTGTPLTAVEYSSPTYWSEALSSTTPLSRAILRAEKSKPRILLECSPCPCLEDVVRDSLSDTGETLWLGTLQGDKNCIHDLMESLGALFVRGVEIDWPLFNRNFRRKKFPIPLYPFQRKRFWAEGHKHHDNNQTTLPQQEWEHVTFDPAHQFFTTRWKAEALAKAPEKAATDLGTTLIWKDVKGKGEKVAQLLREAGNNVVTVWKGDGYRKIRDDEYEIGGMEEDFSLLLQAMDGKNLSRIIHLQTVLNRTEVRRVKDLHELLELGLFSLCRLVKTLATELPAEKVEIILISEYVNEVTGREYKLVPEHASFFGFGKVVSTEEANISCRCIDVDHFISPETLFSEIAATNSPYLVAYRDEVRYVEELCPFHPPKLPEHTLQLKQEGVYIITGGAGEVGLEIAKLLASRNAGNIALINRSLFPAPEHWKGILEEGSKLYRRIVTLQKITSYDANISFYSADISDNDSLEEILIELRREFGTINGIFHCAGVTPSSSVEKETVEELEDTLKPKVYGTWLLDTLTRQDHLEFFILFSSASTLYQHAAHAAYIAANSYLDAYPAFGKKVGRKMQTINWAPWRETETFSEFDDEGLFKPLLTEEALTAFRKIMESGEKRVIVGQLNTAKDIRHIHFSLEASILKAFEKSPEL